MTEACPSSPLARRQPRRGDSVVSAPFGNVDVEGVVVSATASRLTLNSVKDGRLTIPLERFTWKIKAKHWICWPADMGRLMKQVTQADEDHERARFGIKPQVGDFALVDGKCGWISRLYAKPVKSDPGVGAIFHHFAGYEITTAAGPFRVEGDKIAFDAEARLWVATP